VLAVTGEFFRFRPGDAGKEVDFQKVEDGLGHAAS
jgi:hypothetical protein